MNFDPVSSLRGKAPSIWESLWTGLNALQYLIGIFGSSERCFAFTLREGSINQLPSTLEIWEVMPELLPGMTGETYDNGTTPIRWEIESAALLGKEIKPMDVMCSLRDGEMAVSNVQGAVSFEIFYRPDQYSCWVPWHQFSICGSGRPQYFPRLGFGEPSPGACVGPLNTPARDAYSFQIKIVTTGTCTINRVRIAAMTLPTPKFQSPSCGEPVCANEACDDPADGSTDIDFYRLQGG